jgi:hypothetical protein
MRRFWLRGLYVIARPTAGGVDALVIAEALTT